VTQLAPFPETFPVTAPIRAGKPRSFWSILGLSVITLGIYWIVYHYLVALELKSSLRWTNSDRHKPAFFVWLYTAYIIFFALLLMTSSFGAAVLAFRGDFDPGSQGYRTFHVGLGAIGIALDIYLLYLGYYFLKMNALAGEKTTGRAMSVFRPFAAYTLVFVINVCGSVVSTYFSLKGQSLIEEITNPIRLAVGAILFAMWIGFFALGASLYFLWEQTKLVNRVWLEGRFTNDVAPAIAGAFSSATVATTASSRTGEHERPKQFFE